MQGSADLNEIAPALVDAQESLANPKTDSKARVLTKSGGSYEYAYLSLPALLEAVREVFKGVGLALVQEVMTTDRGVGIVTRIIHKSGQWLETGPLVLPATGGPQDHGSAITYARRYALAAAVGLAPEEDDDAARTSEAAEPDRGRGARPSEPVGATGTALSGGTEAPTQVSAGADRVEAGETANPSPAQSAENDFLMPPGKYEGMPGSAIARAHPGYLRSFLPSLSEEDRAKAERWLNFHHGVKT